MLHDDHRRQSDPPQLPLEIWMDIFEKVSRRPTNSLNTTIPPWTLGHVCATWRSLVLSTSSLWSTVILPVPSLEIKPAHYILREHLLRSGQHPLNIAVRAPRDLNPQDSDNRLIVLKELMTVLLDVAERWLVVELDIHQGFLDSMEIHRMMHERLVLLEEFYLKNQQFHIISHSGDVAQSLLCAPRLRKADFRESRFRSAPMISMNVTHLGCTLNSLRDVSFLTSYASVTELHLDCWSIGEAHGRPIVLPTIEKLGVRYSTILGALTLPALDTLTVRDHTPTSCRILDDFIKRSACTLTVLSLLSGALLAEVDLTNRAFCCVNRVTLPVPKCASETMVKLTAAAVLPSLKVLTVMVEDIQFTCVEGSEVVQKISKEEFIGFLRRRKGLRLLRVYCSDMDFATLQDAGLRELENEGLKVTLDNFNSNHDEWKWWKGPYWFPTVTIP